MGTKGPIRPGSRLGSNLWACWRQDSRQTDGNGSPEFHGESAKSPILILDIPAVRLGAKFVTGLAHGSDRWGSQFRLRACCCASIGATKSRAFLPRCELRAKSNSEAVNSFFCACLPTSQMLPLILCTKRHHLGKIVFKTLRIPSWSMTLSTLARFVWHDLYATASSLSSVRASFH